jgi:hypothetical protein
MQENNQLPPLSELPQAAATTVDALGPRIWYWLGRLWRRFENIIFGLVVAILLLYFVLQSAWVQNWLIGKVTRHLSEELNTTVSVGRVDFSLFDHLVLERVFIADQEGDTLIYAGQLTAGLSENLFSLWSNRLIFNEITLKNAKVHLKRAEGSYDHNIQFLLDYFGGKSNGPKKEKQPFGVRIQHLRLLNVTFLQDDLAGGVRLRATVPSLTARVNKLDAPMKVADLESLYGSGIRVVYQEVPYQKLPPQARVATPVDTSTVRVNRIWHFNVHHINLENCDVQYDNERNPDAPKAMDGVLDQRHIAARNLDFQADSLRVDERLNLRMQLTHFGVRERCGFAIVHAEAKQLLLSDTMTALYGLRLETDRSQLGDTIVLHYNEKDDNGKRLGFKSFKQFNSAVRMDFRLDERSRIALGDLRFFDEKLAKNVYLTKNKDLVAELQGNIQGSVNNLNGEGFQLRVGEGLVLKARFNLDNIAKSVAERRVSVTIEQLQTDMATLKELVPGFKPPSSFDKLGNVQFSGKYDLFFGTDHILEGKVKTSIGYGEVNMNLKKEPGMEAQYSGNLEMHQFDLGAWTGNKDLGPTSFELKIAEGSGLTRSTVNARLEGIVDTFSFRGYRYKAILMNGRLSRDLFDGKLAIKDPNFDFVFDGTVNMRDSTPTYNFGARLNKLDLRRLNLTDDDLIVSGVVDTVRLTGRNLDELFGFAVVRDVQIIQNTSSKTIVHKIDSVRFDSRTSSGSMRRFSLRSDVLDMSVEGMFNFDRSPRDLVRIVAKNHPDLAQRFGIKVPADSIQVRDIYRFGLFVYNTKDLTKLIDKQLDTLKNISIGGSVNGPLGLTEAHVTIPGLKYSTVRVNDIRLNWQGNRDEAEYTIQLPSTQLSKRFKINAMQFTGDVLKDRITFSLKTQDTTAMVQGVDFNGVLTFPDSVAQFKFSSSRFDLFNQRWGLDSTNYVRIGNKYIETNDFELYNDANQRIALTSINAGKGLDLALTNFDLDFVNKVIPSRGIKYRGFLTDFGIQVQDVFEMKDTRVFVATDTVFLNNKPYGRIDGTFGMATMDDPLEWGISSHDDSLNLSFNGAWNFNGKEIKPTKNGMGMLSPNQLNSTIVGYNFPMNIVQQFVAGISKTDGRFDIDATFAGKIAGKNTAVGLNGDAKIRRGEFQIDYLKTMYYIKNQPVRLTDYLIKVDSGIVTDRAGHKAIVHGGLTHDFFRKFQIDCKVWSLGNDFLVLKTTKADNPLYYGTGIGRFTAQFSGTFARTDIRVDATASRGSRLFIPLSDVGEVKEVSFIRYKPKPGAAPVADNKGNKANRRFSVSDIKGLNFEMNLTLTDQAMVEMIFDEAAGDVLTGWGEGNIQVIINREGEFKMYGHYEVRRGEYLFTLLNFVNKPFAVAKGGTIDWYGDPYGAQINLDAIYDENTPVFNLLRDELNTTASEAITNEAKRPTTARVVMHMTKDLFKPDIAFDFEFPNVPPQLKSYTDNKLRLLKQDPNEVSRQVFGLIVFGSFLPPDEFAPQSVGDAVNTITQLVSTQLSNYLTGLASEWFGGTVSSFNFDLAYDQFDVTGLNGAATTQGSAVQVQMSSGFINDRVTIKIGTQIGTQNVLNTGTQFSEDIVVEIQPLENSQWRVRAYQRGEPNLVDNGYRWRYGIGLNFSKDFNNFDDLRQGVGDMFKSRKKGKQDATSPEG